MVQVFNQAKLLKKSTKGIRKLARRIAGQQVYALAIDANFLCLNTEQGFSSCLARYQEEWPQQYENAEEVASLRENPADFEYWKFCQLRFWNGFDWDLYDDHYRRQSRSQKPLDTPYRRAMNTLLAAIADDGVLELLDKTPDFRMWVASDAD